MKSASTYPHVAFPSNACLYAVALLVAVVVPVSAAAQKAQTKPPPENHPKTVEIAALIGGALKEYVDNKGWAVYPGRLAILRHDGEGGYAPVYQRDRIKVVPAMAKGDLDNDGVEDIVCAHGGGVFYTTFKDNHFVEKKIEEGTFPIMLGNDLSAGNMDQKGGDDVILLYGDTIKFYAFGDNGEFRKYEHPGGKYFKSVTTGDVDGDGTDEFVSVPGTFEGPVLVGEMREGKPHIEHVIGYDAERRAREKGVLVPVGQLQDYDIEGWEGEAPELVCYGIKDPVCAGGPEGRDIALNIGAGPAASRFQVMRFNGKGFENFYVSEKTLGDNLVSNSIAFGDATNDGTDDLLVPCGNVNVYRYRGDTLEKVWESEDPSTQEDIKRASTIRVADTDGDGLNEIWASFWCKGGDKYSSTKIHVYGNRGKGETEFYKEWESEIFGQTDRCTIVTGDFDGS